MDLESLLELIIVDDCSTDKTPEIGQQLESADLRVRYIRQSKNAGKTEALKIGIALTKGAVVIVQDADLEYDPTEIMDVVMPIVTNRA